MLNFYNISSYIELIYLMIFLLKWLLEEKNGCEPSPIECFRLMHMKKDGVTFASEKAQKLYVCYYYYYYYF